MAPLGDVGTARPGGSPFAARTERSLRGVDAVLRPVPGHQRLHFDDALVHEVPLLDAVGGGRGHAVAVLRVLVVVPVQVLLQALGLLHLGLRLRSARSLRRRPRRGRLQQALHAPGALLALAADGCRAHGRFPSRRLSRTLPVSANDRTRTLLTAVVG